MFCTGPKTVKARKAHQCTWCGQEIEKGEEYKIWSGVCDGVWSTSKMHPECADACQEEAKEWGNDEYTPYTNERPKEDVKTNKYKKEKKEIFNDCSGKDLLKRRWNAAKNYRKDISLGYDLERLDVLMHRMHLKTLIKLTLGSHIKRNIT